MFGIFFSFSSCDQCGWVEAVQQC